LKKNKINDILEEIGIGKWNRNERPQRKKNLAERLLDNSIEKLKNILYEEIPEIKIDEEIFLKSKEKYYKRYLLSKKIHRPLNFNFLINHNFFKLKRRMVNLKYISCKNSRLKECVYVGECNG